MFGSLAAIPLGQVLVGPTADRIGTTPTLIGAAMIVLIATALALASRPVRQLSTEPTDTIG
jgi:MFS family permease